MRYLSTTGIILKKQARAENDNFITIFSPDLGKFNAVSKSSRKLTSSFIGHLEVLNICNFQIYKTQRNLTITQCQLEKSFYKMRSNLEKTLFALMVSEIIQKTTAGEEQPTYEIYHLMTKTLEKIERYENYEFIVEKFKVTLLQLLGILPEIALCFFCRKKWHVGETIWLDQNGHLACQQCFEMQCMPKNLEMTNLGTFEQIPFPLIKLINYLSKNAEAKDLEKISLTAQEQFQLKKIMNIFLSNYLYQEIRSEKIIGKMRN